MGDDIMLLSTHFFCKYPDPESKKHVAWHQDITYWGLEPPEAHTAWIAVDDADVDNGCMVFIPGSHRDGIAQHGTSEREGNLLSINQEIPDELVDSSQAVPIELDAGQISIHDGQLYHASQPNASQRRRCGLTVRFIPPEARQVQDNSLGHQWQPILLRGEDRHHHYPETPPPF
jgi:ectoine hydroxylase-related dioxygenase (phytanoyl-CoA dioxygenase family)